jgi:fluoride ion exporter CrcB/FEX
MRCRFDFPYGVVVNVSGAFVIGLVWVWPRADSRWIRCGVSFVAGFLGVPHSAAMHGSLSLANPGPGEATPVIGSNVVGLFADWLGALLARQRPSKTPPCPSRCGWRVYRAALPTCRRPKRSTDRAADQSRRYVGMLQTSAATPGVRPSATAFRSGRVDQLNKGAARRGGAPG